MAKKPKPKKRPALTNRQRLCLDVIKAYIKKNGWPPSYRDLMDAMDISSPNGIACNLEALEKKGYIVRGQNGESRALRVVK